MVRALEAAVQGVAAAERDLDAAVRLDPSNASAFNNRGYALNAKGEWDRALRDYDEAIRLKPDLSAAFGNRGRTYQNKGDYNEVGTYVILITLVVWILDVISARVREALR